MKEFYSKKDTCYKDITTAREAFRDKTTTGKQYDQIEKTLGIMYLYCPEEIQYIVLATLTECQCRRDLLGI